MTSAWKKGEKCTETIRRPYSSASCLPAIHFFQHRPLPPYDRLMLSRLRSWLFTWRYPPASSRVIIGSTGSGKSEGELVDLVGLANREDSAVILLDGHGPLAFRPAADPAILYPQP